MKINKTLGVVAAGHQETAQAAITILKAGGNAFDAVIAAHCAACVVEPVLSSLGGGGFLLAHSQRRGPILYDFFVQTPSSKRSENETEFFPITADFGITQQVFHIGHGSIATPGSVKGIFAIHQDLCTLPIRELIAPAVDMARQGVIVNHFQSYILEIVNGIYEYHPHTQARYQSTSNPARLIKAGETLKQPELADCLELLADEGADLFYLGEIGNNIIRQCRDHGGHLKIEDLRQYEVYKRKPVSLVYRNSRVLTNPPPSSGGILIAFALKLLEHYENDGQAQLERIISVLSATDQARGAHASEHTDFALMHKLLDPDNVRQYRNSLESNPLCSRGTTHMSIIDASGNMACLSTSNGEGCGFFVADTGIMLNNMLGEEDLNPQGFNLWPNQQRMTSMMAPSILFHGKSQIVLGSGGSNRIRSAILQVLINLVDHQMSLDEAIHQPRIHFEDGLLNLEGGFNPKEVSTLIDHYPNHKIWNASNLFFGGVHSVAMNPKGFHGTGDSRRGGVALIA